MNQQEKENYLDQFGSECFICCSHVDRGDMRLVEATVPIEREGIVGPTLKYYMVCPKCGADKLLV